MEKEVAKHKGVIAIVTWFFRRNLYEWGVKNKCSISFWFIFALISLPCCMFYHNVIQNDNKFSLGIKKAYISTVIFLYLKVVDG